jgi:hypothetical protein
MNPAHGLVRAQRPPARAKSRVAAAVSEVVGSKRFELVDSAGSSRGAMGLNADGSPGLWLEDRNGKARITLASSARAEGQPVLQLSDNDGKVRIAATVNKDGLPGLTLADKDAQARVGMMIVDADGNPALAVSDREGRLCAVLGVASLGKTRAGSAKQTAESSLVLFDKEGKVLWQASP